MGHRSETKGRSSEARSKVVPKGKATFRSFAGQRHSATATSKRGGGGRFNWGNPLDVTDEDVDWDDLGEVEVEVEVQQPPMLFSQRIRSASLSQEEEDDEEQEEEDDGFASPDGVEQGVPKATATSPWVQTSRIEAMKDRLLALEREKIAKMAPERLELMNLLADNGQNVDENTLSALLMWKRQV